MGDGKKSALTACFLVNTRFKAAVGRNQIRISKSETNSNDQNPKLETIPIPLVSVIDKFEFWICFEIRNSDSVFLTSPQNAEKSCNKKLNRSGGLFQTLDFGFTNLDEMKTESNDE